MNKKLWCMNTGCEKCSECNRYKMYEQSSADDREILVVNPRCVADTSQCPYFAHTIVVRNAYGFTNVLEDLPRKVAKEIADALMLHFGRNPYYERRKGERPISPSEQEYINGVFVAQGITQPELFDRYEDQEEWV